MVPIACPEFTEGFKGLLQGSSKAEGRIKTRGGYFHVSGILETAK
jgi:hypothetical protein